MTNNSNKETFEDFFSRKKNGEKREAIWLLLLVVFYVLGIVINKWGGSLSLLTIRFTSNILSVATPGLAFVSFAYGVTFLMEHYKLKKMTPEEKGLEKEIWEYEQKKRKEFNAVEQTMLHD